MGNSFEVVSDPPGIHLLAADRKDVNRQQAKGQTDLMLNLTHLCLVIEPFRGLLAISKQLCLELAVNSDSRNCVWYRHAVCDGTVAVEKSAHRCFHEECETTAGKGAEKTYARSNTPVPGNQALQRITSNLKAAVVGASRKFGLQELRLAPSSCLTEISAPMFPCKAEPGVSSNSTPNRKALYTASSKFKTYGDGGLVGKTTELVNQRLLVRSQQPPPIAVHQVHLNRTPEPGNVGVGRCSTGEADASGLTGTFTGSCSTGYLAQCRNLFTCSVRIWCKDRKKQLVRASNEEEATEIASRFQEAYNMICDRQLFARHKNLAVLCLANRFRSQIINNFAGGLLASRDRKEVSTLRCGCKAIGEIQCGKPAFRCCSSVVAWPSGLRRWTKAPVFSEAGQGKRGHETTIVPDGNLQRRQGKRGHETIILPDGNLHRRQGKRGHENTILPDGNLHRRQGKHGHETTIVPNANLHRGQGKRGHETTIVPDGNLHRRQGKRGHETTILPICNLHRGQGKRGHETTIVSDGNLHRRQEKRDHETTIVTIGNLHRCSKDYKDRLPMKPLLCPFSHYGCSVPMKPLL
ncbi:hypothetical protein E1301_Tti018116 [Triplophysa tibetana]|uniref:Uncharacterized protein n=1 Tax=Triplophysa tibetana TaxID=1572043 RepID=A0A5A9PJP6_9TELE|nr:hypothetical protein E1301_Tti018116 [Triplophysa tibetana]